MVEELDEPLLVHLLEHVLSRVLLFKDDLLTPIWFQPGHDVLPFLLLPRDDLECSASPILEHDCVQIRALSTQDVPQP